MVSSCGCLPIAVHEACYRNFKRNLLCFALYAICVRVLIQISCCNLQLKYVALTKCTCADVEFDSNSSNSYCYIDGRGMFVRALEACML